MKKDTYTISELAAELDISPSSIRFYEEKGLLSPRRSSGNQRIYSHRDRVRIKLILRGKRFGASLDEIAEMVGMANADINEKKQIETSLFYLEKKSSELENHKRELKLFERDLADLRKKLMERLNQLNS
ncbi:MAG: MerR family transcriptional regulator [Spirochaetae bacterium HGW-Spirochaetae-5]|nr:MAG: MerR family transcriptional regulator [Spirochaetae bacterium HGW-Spirochaetae-5]